MPAAGTLAAHAAVSENADTEKFTLVDSLAAEYPLAVQANAEGGSDIIVARPVSITLRKDDAEWENHGKAVALYKGTTLAATLTGVSEMTGFVGEVGVYKIYVDGVDTGNSFAVAETGASGYLDYYTVTFNANGGTPTPMQRVVVKDSHLTEPTDPTRGTDRLDGWYSDSTLETAWNFTADEVTATTTLYAKWTAVPLTFDDSAAYDIPAGYINTAQIITTPLTALAALSRTASRWSPTSRGLASTRIISSYLRARRSSPLLPPR